MYDPSTPPTSLYGTVEECPSDIEMYDSPEGDGRQRGDDFEIEECPSDAEGLKPVDDDHDDYFAHTGDLPVPPPILRRAVPLVPTIASEEPEVLGSPSSLKSPSWYSKKLDDADVDLTGKGSSQSSQSPRSYELQKLPRGSEYHRDGSVDYDMETSGNWLHLFQL